MTPLLLKPTKSTPLVWLDPFKGFGRIVGCSLPENAAEFYAILFSWLDTNLPLIEKAMKWEIRLNYFNTSSTKGIYQVLFRIKTHKDLGHEHSIVWDVEDDDEFMRDAGQNFIDLLELPMELRELDEDTARVADEKLRMAFDRELIAADT